MSYKVLLVDDDRLVRIGLRSFIDWKEKGLEIVGEASDGNEALRLAGELHPDIVITDMYMPEFDGLHFIQQARLHYPEMMFIVLSCHDDIHYVKESLRLGAYDYLLKSSIVDSGELDDVLTGAIRTLDEARSKTVHEEAGNISPEVLALSYLGGTKELRHKFTQLLQQNKLDANADKLFLLGLQMDNYATCMVTFLDGKLLCYAVRNILEEIIAEYGGGIVVNEDQTFYLLLDVVSKNSFISQKDKALSICERLRISIKNNLKNTCSIYLDSGRNISDLPEAFAEISAEIAVNSHLYYDTIVNIGEGFDVMRIDSGPPAVITDTLDKVIAYIHQNYSAQITLEELAGIANFSKYHLCKKFKEKTKTSIINYIIMVRVDKAKELLLQKHYKIFEVAQQVGFNDASYFNRIFKKITGYTPKEFVDYNYSVRTI